MVYPVNPDATYDYTTYQAGLPTTPLPAAQVEGGFDDHKVAIDEIIAFIKLSLASNGNLKADTVGQDQLTTAVLALMGGWNPRGAWATATVYAVQDWILEAGESYVSLTAHTSGTFATDLAAGKWALVAEQGSNAYTTTTAGFTMPAIHATVSVAVTDSAWASVGQVVYVATAGFLEVTALADSTHMTLRNLGATGNAAAAASIATAKTVSTAGATGAAWYSGAGAPSDLVGANGDFYLRSSNGIVYQKAAGTWGSLAFSLIGPTGATGSTGATGAAGPGVPAGGSTGQFIRKASGTDYDAAWVTFVAAYLPVDVVINREYAEYTTNADLSAFIPNDDTIPQVGEGTQILSLAITTTGTNRVRVKFETTATNGGGSPDSMSAAIFRDGAANAIASRIVTNANNNYSLMLGITFEDNPGAAGTYTYTVRIGANSMGMRLNGTTAARQHGGAQRATLILEEIKL